MNPLVLFLLLFVGAPLVELYFLIKVGSQIGPLPTLSLTIFTALLGGWLVRRQGLATLTRVKSAMARGEMPAFEMMEGFILLVCGLFLLLPGFITDIVGFVFLIPWVRFWLLIIGLKHNGVRKTISPSDFAQESEFDSRTTRVIEGEFKREDRD
jgi:UPF0716 protein FxsA